MNDLRDVVIVDGVRTPFVKAGAEFKGIRAQHLGRAPLRELLERLEITNGATGKNRVTVDEVCFGNVGNPEDAANITRVIAMLAGLDQKISAYTVHRNCASGMEAIGQAWIKIGASQADVMMVGGVESMSNLPLIYGPEMTGFFINMMRAKTIGQKLGTLLSFRLSHLKPIISVEQGLTDPFCGLNMGQTAENIARDFGITRDDQDRFALESHRRAVEAMESGKLAEEIVPVPVPMKYTQIVKDDIGPRKGQTMEQLKKLKPFFDRANGTVTVGNACPITDGAVALAIMSKEKALSAGYQPLGKIRSVAFAGLEPERMGLGPVFASALALKKAGLSMSDMDLIEFNEAFAAQVIGCMRASASKKFCEERLGMSGALGEIDPAKLNVNGGAIAYGHPVGASGARIVLTALKELKRRGKRFALASLCIGGGQGGAVVVERE
jgi:acetyl-CoA acetyltransferase family protein